MDFENEILADAVVVPDELAMLKERADLMGIKYHPSIGVANLKIKVDEALTKDDTVKPEEAVTVTPVFLAKSQATMEDVQRIYHTRLRREANRLVRVRVTCMNPNKKSWPGEVFTVSNSVIGTIKKFVPFNIEGGFHIPHVIYEQLQERKYQMFAEVKYPNGTSKKTGKLVKEFAIEVLDPLTDAEMKDLAIAQAMNHSID